MTFQVVEFRNALEACLFLRRQLAGCPQTANSPVLCLLELMGGFFSRVPIEYGHFDNLQFEDKEGDV
jgi:hypothetical protein